MFAFLPGRYSRQLAMPEWGAAGQECLRRARVCIIGAGGVKASLLRALAAAGVGHIRIVEHDSVELSNLNRQTLFCADDIGKKKGAVARRTLVALNPEIDVDWVDARFEERNARTLIDGYDFIVEGGDSPYGRNLVNRVCWSTKQPYVHASAQFSYGYVFSVIPAWRTTCFACVFPDEISRVESTGPVPVNVLATQVAGALGAAEVIKWLLGHHDSMVVNERLCFSSLLLSGEFERIPQPQRDDCQVCRET